MVGATMTIAIGSIQVAFEEATNRWVNTALGGDLMVSSDREQPVELRARLRRWGAARGWGVTVAPTGPLC
jgi:predicted lysophospholipase L1 biosynthesis ABC-type transport system permease subunit